MGKRRGGEIETKACFPYCQKKGAFFALLGYFSCRSTPVKEAKMAPRKGKGEEEKGEGKLPN
jgi:hypothetical protein